MAAAFEIPLTPTPQSFLIALSGTQYRLTVRWNTAMSLWVLDIADASGTAIVSGIALVANVDLLGPYPYLNFGGKLIAQSDNDPNASPTFDSLGVTSHLYWVTP